MKKQSLFAVVALAFLLAHPFVFGQENGEEHPMRVVTLIAPQFAVGWAGEPGKSGSLEIQMELQVVNRSAEGREYEMWYTDDHGEKMSILSTNLASTAKGQWSYAVAFLRGRSSTLNCITYCQDNRYGNCESPSLKKGWARFDVPQSWDDEKQEYVNDILILLVYQIKDHEGSIIMSEGVSPIQCENDFLMPAAIWPQRDFGLAIANYWNSENTVWLTLYEENQIVAEKEVHFGPGEQISKFLSEFFSELPKNSRGNIINQGSLEIRSERPIAITSLKIDKSPNGSMQIAGTPAFPGRSQ